MATTCDVNPSTCTNEKRRQPRFLLKRGASVLAFVRVNEEETEVPASVLDLSKSGAKLELSEATPIKGRVTVRFQCEFLDIAFSQIGTVCWVRSVEDHKWWIGCSFDDDVDDMPIDLLAKAGFLERRQDQREFLNIPVKVRRECNPESVNVRMLDLSAGGFLIRGNQEAKPGERVVLCFGNGKRVQQPIVARVQWCFEEDNGLEFRIGCAFLNREGFNECRQRVAVLPPTSRLLASAQPWWIVLLGVTTAGLGAYFVWQHFA